MSWIGYIQLCPIDADAPLMEKLPDWWGQAPATGDYEGTEWKKMEESNYEIHTHEWKVVEFYPLGLEMRMDWTRYVRTQGQTRWNPQVVVWDPAENDFKFLILGWYKLFF